MLSWNSLQSLLAAWSGYCHAATLSACWVALSVVAHAAEKPNIVIILADDLGYGDTSCYGGKIPTPAIDGLARQGLRFTNAYAPAATCTPTRYALLTGQYAWRQPAKKTSILDGDAPLAIEVASTTIASMLKDAGYTTGVVGKWHLGLGDGQTRLDFNGTIQPGPNEVGFDYSYILPATVDRVPTVWIENHKVDKLETNDPIAVSYQHDHRKDPNGLDQKKLLKVPADKQHSGSIHNGISRIGYQAGGRAARFVDEDLPLTVVERSQAFIEQNKARPFFLLVGLFEPHVPRSPHAKFAGKSGHGVRGDVIMQADWEVQQILDKLQASGLDENTIVILTSDNGPVLFDGYYDESEKMLGAHEPTARLRGGKYLVYEGGTRIPFIVRWPQSITQGVCNQLLSLTDLLATFASITGQKIPAGQARDSLSMLPLLTGTTRTSPRTSLILQGVFDSFALRKDHWKFVKANAGKDSTSIGRGANSDDPRFASAIVKEDELYDLASDPHEKHNVAQQFPDKVAEMQAELQEIMQ